MRGLRHIATVPDAVGDIQYRNIRGWMQMVLTPYDLFSWNKHDINLNIIDNPITFEYIDKGLWECSLCARWALSIMPDSSFLLPPAPCCLLPCWELTAYLASCLGGLALPRPLPLSWPHFPQVPGNTLPLCQVQLLYQTMWSRYRNVVLRGHAFEQGEPLGWERGNGEGEGFSLLPTWGKSGWEFAPQHKEGISK